MTLVDIDKLQFDLLKYKQKLAWVAKCLWHEYNCPVCATKGCNQCPGCFAEVALADPWVKEALESARKRSK